MPVKALTFLTYEEMKAVNLTNPWIYCRGPNKKKASGKIVICTLPIFCVFTSLFYVFVSYF